MNEIQWKKINSSIGISNKTNYTRYRYKISVQYLKNRSKRIKNKKQEIRNHQKEETFFFF